MEFSLYLMDDTRKHIDEVFRNDYKMGKIGTTVVDDIEVIVDNQPFGYSMEVSFYYKKNDAESTVKWGEYWSSLVRNNKNFDKGIESVFGAILISFDNRNYVISLGRAFNYVSKLCNGDFGLDLAEMCLSEEGIIIKSAKFFMNSKNKSLTSYRKFTHATFEVGESNEFVVGNLNLNSKYLLFNIYKHSDRIKFGSAIKFRASGYKPRDILAIVAELNKIYTDEKENRQYSLPRFIIVKNNEDNKPITSTLDRMLLEDLTNGKSVSSTLSYFEIESREVILTPESNQRIKLIYDRNKYDIEFTLGSIISELRKINCQNIDKVSISNEDTGISKKIKNYLDYRTVLSGKNYCLYNGKWAYFNQSYLENINREIQNVNSICEVDHNYDLTNHVLDEGARLRIELGLDADVTYSEYQYNIFMSNKNNDLLLDRKRNHGSFKNIEFADIYIKELESLMHVKIGSTKELRYCIEQSLRSAEIYSVHGDVLEEYDIYKVKEVSMLFVTGLESIFDKNGNVDFSKSSSLYFKAELIEWMNRIRSFNLSPKIYVAKDLR